MTKALALIEAGRLADARSLVLREVGTPEQPQPLRNAAALYHLPIDSDPSVAALAATAYMIRASWQRSSPEYPETMADLRAALRIVPNNATLHLQYAEALIGLRAYDEAKTEIDRLGATKTSIEADPRFQTHLQIIRDKRLQTMKRWPNGPPKPGANSAANPWPFLSVT